MKIKIAKRQTLDKINELRVNAYKNASQSIIRNYSFLHWNEVDDESMILYIESDHGTAISSMRGLLVNSLCELEKLFDVTINKSLEFPLLVIDRSTTLLNHRGHGLSAVLRFLFIKQALGSKIKNIASTINNGVSRIPQLKKIGYELEYADTSQRKKVIYENSSEVLLAILNYTFFQRAIEVAKDSLDLSSYQIDSEIYTELDAFFNCHPVLV